MSTGMRGGADIVADLSGVLPALEKLVLQQSAAGAATFAGFFVDSEGQQIVSGTTYSYSLTIPAAGSAATLKEILGAAIPTGAQGQKAVGFIGRLSADIIYSTGAINQATPTALATDMNSNLARYPLLKSGTLVTLGRVG